MPFVIARLRRSAIAGVLVGVALVATVVLPVGTGTAWAKPATGTDRNGTYLALGDSVAFGYVPPNAIPAPNYFDADLLPHLPKTVQQLLPRARPSARPGETTASMLTAGAQSNGCQNSVGSSVGYRTQYPLHVHYRGTQMAYALRYLGRTTITRS